MDMNSGRYERRFAGHHSSSDWSTGGGHGSSEVGAARSSQSTSGENIIALCISKLYLNYKLRVVSRQWHLK